MGGHYDLPFERSRGTSRLYSCHRGKSHGWKLTADGQQW
jgi:hypothetical protein